jgi:hypothetical protein
MKVSAPKRPLRRSRVAPVFAVAPQQHREKFGHEALWRRMESGKIVVITLSTFLILAAERSL